ncbi:MAG: alpha-L-arabinofuranosidase C-terminal domain-containing protein, partial [Clostridium sp.]|nr:alpha-L-arabinofuranosidase C-terminal domain-containing protein [Clostridium sp.]
DGLSLHYYTHPGGWEHKGPATGFDDKVWYESLKKTLKMEELIDKHIEIMNKYDKEKRVGLIVDEWGGWYDVEPGTNPGFLYQQNTMRDALIAGINLNVFNKHCDRVKMANIAQMVNVLQAVILTEGDKMVLTPTYHVFNMYKNHQEATLVDSYIETETIGVDDSKVPNLHESVSVDSEGKVNITINNLSIADDYDVESVLVDKKINSVKAEILTGDMNAHNTFDDPEAVKPVEFTDYKITDQGMNFKIPACSVISFVLE